MTMISKARTVPAATFKAKCLALLDEVAATGVPLVVTKRGRPVARIEPIEADAPKSLRGSVLRERDIVSPIEDDWSADS
jgi:prevent-host-death family protein